MEMIKVLIFILYADLILHCLVNSKKLISESVKNLVSGK